MQRPVMDITYLEDVAPETARRQGKRRVLATIGRLIYRVLRAIVRVLMFDPLSRTRLARFRNDDGSPLSRFLRGLGYRMVFAPVLVALASCALVYSGTHPGSISSDLDPSSLGIYYDAITYRSSDGVRIEAWLVPAIDARDVIDRKEKVLREKRPTVILLHDFGNRQQQMLPLMAALHDAGFVVLVPALRGCGPSQRAGQTFGLNEALDVKGAIEMLRKRPFVDPARISLVGVGTGANAALITAAADAKIEALVLSDPSGSLDEVVARHIVPEQTWFKWIHSMCKWTFEISYKVDSQDLSAERFAETMKSRPALMLDGSATTENFAAREKVEQIRHFLVVKTAMNASE